MRITNCVLCKENVIISNCTDGICRLCWNKIENGDEITISAYLKHNTLLEAFPKQRGRVII